jgi:hypothetical protein
VPSARHPGDDRLDDPLIKLTYAIEAAAAPADIWPWLPLVRLADHFHQKEILKGLKRRVEAERETKRIWSKGTGQLTTTPKTGQSSPSEAGE